MRRMQLQQSREVPFDPNQVYRGDLSQYMTNSIGFLSANGGHYKHTHSVVIYGVPECSPNGAHPNLRLAFLINQVYRVIACTPSEAFVIATFRMGVYQPGSTRPVKVVLANSHLASALVSQSQCANFSLIGPAYAGIFIRPSFDNRADRRRYEKANGFRHRPQHNARAHTHTQQPQAVRRPADNGAELPEGPQKPSTDRALQAVAPDHMDIDADTNNNRSSSPDLNDLAQFPPNGGLVDVIPTGLVATPVRRPRVIRSKDGTMQATVKRPATESPAPVANAAERVKERNRNKANSQQPPAPKKSKESASANSAPTAHFIAEQEGTPG